MRQVVLAIFFAIVGCDDVTPELPLAELGEPCVEHEDCVTELCLGEVEAAVCSQSCVDEDDCPEGESCRLLEVTRDEAAAVESACQPSTAGGGLLFDDCESGDLCLSGLCVAGRCTELCESCGPGAVCVDADVTVGTSEVTAQVCALDLGAPDMVLGPVPATAEGSEPVELEIPEGLASFTIQLLHDGGNDYGTRVTFLTLESPDGTVLLDFEDLGPDVNPAAIPYPGATSVLVPSTDHPAALPQAGTYRFTAGFYQIQDATFVPVPGEVDEVRVLFEPLGQEGGLLDLNLFFSPGSGVTAAEAPTSDFVTAMLDRVISYYLPSGLIRFGEVAYYDIPETYDVIETGDEARELWHSHSLPGPRGMSVNAFIVDSIDFGSGVAGFTSGTPGPAGIFGTPASGLVVANQGGGPRTGVTVAHELGHFLGLRHTTRLSYAPDGTMDVMGEDGIGDTPFCEGGAIAECPDYRNLMFPLYPQDGLALTAAQLAVVEGNPILYELDRPRACGVTSSTFDLTDLGFGAGETTSLGDSLAGSCGGTGAPERLHLYRLPAGANLSELQVTVHAQGFAPALHVRLGDCGDATTEVLCETGAADVDLNVSLETPAAGSYFLAVDGAEADGAGPFSITVTEVAAE